METRAPYTAAESAEGPLCLEVTTGLSVSQHQSEVILMELRSSCGDLCRCRAVQAYEVSATSSTWPDYEDYKHSTARWDMGLYIR